MQLQSELVGGVRVVVLPGPRLDAEHALAFKEAMTPLLSPGARLVLDCSPVEFVDSSGLSTLIACLRGLRAVGGELRLGAMSRSVAAVFELVRLDRVFVIRQDVQTCLAEFADA